MKSKLSSKAFTLLEILLVVGIIAILAGIVIIAINPGKQLASVRNTQRLSDLKQLNNAITQFYIDKGTYPASTTLSTTTLTEICNTGSVSATTTSVTGNPCGTLTNLSELVPTYIVAIPVDPSGASSTLSFIPTAYANVNGTGYKIMRTPANQIVEQAPLSELNVQVAIGNVGLSALPWVPISGLVAHYLMNDTDGSTVVDSKNGYNGSGSYSVTTGLTGGAVSFNGSTNYLSLPLSGKSIAGTNARTVSMWIKPIVGSQNNVNGTTLFNQGNWGSPHGNFALFYAYVNASLTNGLYFAGYQDDASGHDGTITQGQWNLITATYDGTTVKVYVNGSVDITYNTSTLNTNDSTFYIGKTSTNNNKFIGSVDDVRIYNRALTTNEISQIYNGGVGTSAE